MEYKYNTSVDSIAIISDPQIDIATGNGEIEILKRCFQNIKADALTICGDITENGLAQE